MLYYHDPGNPKLFTDDAISLCQRADSVDPRSHCVVLHTRDLADAPHDNALLSLNAPDKLILGAGLTASLGMKRGGLFLEIVEINIAGRGFPQGHPRSKS